jgi:hypothetical protein
MHQTFEQAITELKCNLAQNNLTAINEMLDGPCSLTEVKGTSVFLKDGRKRVELVWNEFDGLFEYVM